MDVKRRTEVLDHVIHHLLDLFLGSLGPFSTMETTSSSQPIRPIRTFENTVVPWHVVHMRVTASFPLSSGNGGPGAFISASLIRIRTARVRRVNSCCVLLTRGRGGGFSGNGCVGDDSSPSTSLFGTGRSSTPNTGLPVMRSRMNSRPIFVICATAGLVLTLRFTSISAGGALKS